jgi:flagellar biosynthesis protein FliR
VNFDVNAAWVAGLLLALARTAGFASASPIVSRTFPPIGRVAFALGVSLAVAHPVDSIPGALPLLGFTLANVALGIVLGFATGLILYLFEVAGSMLDLTSGLANAAILDPTTRAPAGPFDRMVRMSAMAVFFVIGGDRMAIKALAASSGAVPFLSGFSVQGSIGRDIVASVGQLFVAALELAAPAVAALFVAELVLAIAARMAPQMNVFLLGMPVKLLVAFAAIGAVLALLPGSVHGAVDTMVGGFAKILQTLHG